MTAAAAKHSRHRRYPEYWDSGVEWMRELPRHWSTARLKAVSDLVTERAQTIQSEQYIGLEHVESMTGRLLEDPSDAHGIDSNESGRTRFRPDDVLFGKLRPYLAKVLTASFEGACSTEFVVCRPRLIRPRFLAYVLRSQPFIAWVNTLTYGTKMPRLDPNTLAVQRIPSPACGEQDAISVFLDRETAKIDALIAKKEQLQEQLSASTDAVVAQVVTRGLRDEVLFKQAGLAVVPTIPKDWDALSLRRVVTKFVDYRGQTPEKSSAGVPLVTARNIKSGRIEMDLSREFIDESLYEGWMVRGLPELDDLLITTEAPLGEVALVTDPSIALAQRVILLKCNRSRVRSRFLRYWFLSIAGRAELETRSTGSTAVGIKASHLREAMVAVPPLPEQDLIIEHLDRLRVAAEAPRTALKKAIRTLEELRSALISCAVTGKIDVRQEVA